MGTRSRIVIRRYTVPNIHLWMHWDGYFAGQGDRICEELARLLRNYSFISLQSKVEEMTVENLPEDECQEFSGELLADFIEGNTIFKNDTCDDIEYEYMIDFKKGLLLAKHFDKTFVVRMACIQEGFRISELGDYEHDDD
jgi:hypothetical protein